jgi:mono/diheme cytochrome c family protein
MLACTTLLLPAQGLVTETTPRRGGNPNAAKRANPVPRSPASVEAGRRTYQRLCARCHGIAGKGDGGGAGAGGQPADLTDATWEFGSTDGEIFSVIREGTSADMESYAEQVPETEIWNLVNFIRTLAEAREAR